MAQPPEATPAASSAMSLTTTNDAKEKDAIDHQESFAEHSGADQDHTIKPKPWLRKTTPWARIVGHNYKGGGTESDPYVVTWLPDGPDGFVDVENPLKYGFWYKWGVTILGESSLYVSP